MKKAFDQNVSRAKPRLRLGALLTEPVPAETMEAETVAAPAPVPTEPVATAPLLDEVKARVERAKQPKPSAVEAVQRALEIEPPRAPVVAAAPVAPVAIHHAPEEIIEIHQPPEPAPEREHALEPAQRRERLKERLKAVRENPRPEPLPASVVQAGVLAVERIAHLQAELSKLKAVNLALTQDLESARRQAERATDEARLRMDEAKRLSAEMDARAKLLSELERELSSLEGERDEAMLALQESRQGLTAAAGEKDALRAQIAEKDRALNESLEEEERIAAELESAKEDAAGLRRTVDALTSERDTLARQVSDLTREVSELLEARRALEAVHRALSSAAFR